MLISGTPLTKENLILFTQNCGITIVVLTMIYIDLIFIMNQAVHVDVSVKTVITLLWNVLLYDNIRRHLLVILRIYSEIDLNVILYANTELPIDQNKDIFLCFKSF